MKRSRKNRPQREEVDCDLQQFEDIMAKVNDLIDEAYQIVCDKLGRDSQAARSANAYWKRQIKYTVAGTGSMETMEDTLNKMKNEQPFHS